MRLAHFAIGLLLSLVLSACVSSVHPLSEPENSPLDPDLSGTWFFKAEEEGYLHIAPDENNTYDLLMVGTKSAGGLDIERGSFFTTQLNGKKFINLKYPLRYPPPKETEKTSYYEFVMYEIKDRNQLYIYIMSTRETVKAVELGVVKGTIHRDMGTSVNLTSSSQELARWIAESDLDKLFCESGKSECRLGPFIRMNPDLNASSHLIP